MGFQYAQTQWVVVEEKIKNVNLLSREVLL